MSATGASCFCTRAMGGVIDCANCRGVPWPAATPVCLTCNDTHVMAFRGRDAPCTRCPMPCPRCKGVGPYCGAAECECECHKGPGLDRELRRCEHTIRKPVWSTADSGAVIRNRLYSCMPPVEALRRGLMVESRGGECDCTMIAGHLLECGSCRNQR